MQLTRLEMLLIWVILGTIGLMVVYVLFKLVYNLIYPHYCRVRFIRTNGVLVKNKRFRLKKDKEKGWRLIVSGLKNSINIEKPDEDFFEMINKNKLYTEIVVLENGEAYCIKPVIKELGKNIEYKIYNRNVLNALKQELKSDIYLYQWKSGLAQIFNIVMIVLIIIIITLGFYFNNKVIQKSIEANKESSAIINEGIKSLSNAISNFTEVYGYRINGSINNPLPFNPQAS